MLWSSTKGTKKKQKHPSANYIQQGNVYPLVKHEHCQNCNQRTASCLATATGKEKRLKFHHNKKWSKQIKSGLLTCASSLCLVGPAATLWAPLLFTSLKCEHLHHKSKNQGPLLCALPLDRVLRLLSEKKKSTLLHANCMPVRETQSQLTSNVKC